MHCAPLWYDFLTLKLLQFTARAVLFDWDGTLLNSYAADVRAYLSMFHALEIDWTEREVAVHYSPNWHRVYTAAEIPRSKWLEADRLWARAYKLEKPPLLPGARHILRMLSAKFALGIVTSGNRARVRRQLREFALADYFSACVCSEDAVEKKPHPAPLQLALKRLRLAPEDCVYVGDTAEDIEMSRHASVRAIGVLGPFPTAARIRASKPEILLGSIRDLPRHLRTVG
ncbi:MAG: HAD family hydrolase [Candidatus Acidiferrales bacterium]